MLTGPILDTTREIRHHPGAVANLPVELFNDVVSTDPCPILGGEIVVDERLLNTALYLLGNLF